MFRKDAVGTLISLSFQILSHALERRRRSEHERHSPNCPFVKGEHTQNVPLSVTLATSPAQFPNSPDTSDKMTCFGFGTCPQFLAAATKRGKICIWDISKIMKVGR